MNNCTFNKDANDFRLKNTICLWGQLYSPGVLNPEKKDEKENYEEEEK